MFSSHLFRASFGAPFFFYFLGFFLLTAAPLQADELIRVALPASDFRTAHEALVEAVELEGLVVGSVLPFSRMLERTAEAPDSAGPYAEAELVQFCSSVLARRMVAEDPAQMALCPMSVALYALAARPHDLMLTYRVPMGDSPGRQAMRDLLGRIARRAVGLAQQGWSAPD